MADWTDKFTQKKFTTYKISEKKEWRFVLEEDKQKGTLQVNARMWTLPDKDGNGYTGPSKNGFIIPISSKDDFDKLSECFQSFVDFMTECKNFVG